MILSRCYYKISFYTVGPTIICTTSADKPLTLISLLLGTLLARLLTRDFVDLKSKGKQQTINIENFFFAKTYKIHNF